MRHESSPSFGLAGRRAIVTGHRGGIGGAIAAALAEHGVEVIGLDLPKFDLAATAGPEGVGRRADRAARAAAVVAFLLSPSAASITGHTLPVDDGGLAAP